jgi:hypothetical protein
MKSWIAEKNSKKNKNILMLDLEQVLIIDSDMLLERDSLKLEDPKIYYGYCRLRPHSKYFVSEIKKLFDTIYMNTCVGSEDSEKIMNEFCDVDFPFFNRHNKLKSYYYDKFPKDVQLFHLEDGILGGLVNDRKNMKRLGVNIIDVSPYKKYKPMDKELLICLDELKNILS